MDDEEETAELMVGKEEESITAETQWHIFLHSYLYLTRVFESTNRPIFALGGHGSVSSEAEKTFKKNPNHSDLSHAVPGSDFLTDPQCEFLWLLYL